MSLEFTNPGSENCHHPLFELVEKFADYVVSQKCVFCDFTIKGPCSHNHTKNFVCTFCGWVWVSEQKPKETEIEIRQIRAFEYGAVINGVAYKSGNEIPGIYRAEVIDKMIEIMNDDAHNAFERDFRD